MKRSVFTLILVFSVFLCFSQADLYYKISRYLNMTHPEISLDNRLIALNVWSTSDNESREANKQFDKAYSIYEFAKLKGGNKGIVVLSISKDNLSTVATIALTKDGVKKMIAVKWEEIEGISPDLSNIVFDSTGGTVYKDLPSGKVFESINQLITR